MSRTLRANCLRFMAMVVVVAAFQVQPASATDGCEFCRTCYIFPAGPTYPCCGPAPADWSCERYGPGYVSCETHEDHCHVSGPCLCVD